MDVNVGKTVVLLLSDKRSGSTIVQNELSKHSLVQHVDYSPHTYFETQHWLKGASLLEMPEQTWYGHKVYGTYKSKTTARTYLVDELVGNQIDITDLDSDRKLVFEGWERLCQKYATPVFFEKSPQYLAQWACLSLILEWIQTTKINVKIIGLVRNPLSVMYSADELFHTAPAVRQFGWADMYRNFLAFREMVLPEQFLTVRYEDLIEHPKTHFSMIQDFIGLPVETEIGQDVHARSRYKWKNDDQYPLQLHQVVKQVARQFGYGDEDLANEKDLSKVRKVSWVARMSLRWKRMKGTVSNRIVRLLRMKFKGK